MTATLYDRERRLVYLETRTLGRPRALAGVGSIYRHFGSWTAAVKAAGIEQPGTPPQRGRQERFCGEAILVAIREAGVSTDGQLTVNSYDRWRDAQRGTGRDSPPTLATIHRRFGGFVKALAAAGVRTSAGRRRASQWSESQLLDALRHAATATPSERLTVHRYEAWRNTQAALDANQHLPRVTAISRHFGSWFRAIECARSRQEP